MQQADANREREFHAGARRNEPAGFSLRTVFWILATGACYYLATRIAWALTFPDSKVSLFFPPHAVLISVLLLVPTRHWWAYTLAAAGSHYFATQQAHWPPLYALHCEVFDAVQNVAAAAGIRRFIKSPFHRITLREAIIFVLIAVAIVPVATAFWGAAFTISNGFGTDYWVEWRNLSISNGVTAIVLVPAILIGVHHVSTQGIKTTPGRVLEAGCLGAGLLVVGYAAFDRLPAGPDTSPALLYAPMPLLIWAALRFGLGGLSTSMLVITILAISGTMHGHGPFLTQTPAENALALQLFLLMLATPLMLLAVAIDDERQSKEALRFSEERMNLAMESAQLVAWEWDMANDRLWTTDEGRKFFGYRPGESIDHVTLGGRVHPDDRAARAAAIQHALATGGSYEAEYRLILPDGSLRWIVGRGRSQSPGAKDAIPRMLGISMDITVRKQAEAEAHHLRQELAHASRVTMLGQLASSLAHELTQPLAAVLSNAQAALRFLNDDPAEVGEVRDILRDIASDDRRASEIIHRMRAMMKKGETQMEARDLNGDVHQALRLLHGDFVARNVSVDTRLSPDLPPVRSDPVQFQQVLLNLLINGCDAMQANAPEERRLVIETARDGPGMIRVSVTDRGTGIAPEMLERIFESFFTTKPQGMGIGLPISRTIIEAHGGRLWAENNAERGATFRFTLRTAGETAAS